ncbi:MAG: hypothetical protein HYU86_07305 [Chloroflexi bacterium]|nr:hypothetical protein [Chloroflexota bacterium]
MSKWEYCAVVGIGKLTRDLNPYYPAIWHFTAEGVQVIQIKGKEAAEVGRTIARLGEEGWEMVGCGTEGGDNSSHHVVYFKRPKS